LSTALRAAFSRYAAGDIDGALLHYAAGLRASPERAESWFSVAALYADRGQYDAALSCARKAVGVAPEHPDALKNLGVILYRMARYDKARVYLEAADARRPADHETQFNLGAVNFAAGDFAASEHWFTEAACTAPTEQKRSVTLCHLAYPVLAQATTTGAYGRGLALYEHGFAQIAKTQVWELGIPEWQGEDLRDKHILVHHDQGVGDTIQFGRYLGELAKRDAMVTLAVPSDLVPLFRSNRAAGRPFSWSNLEVVNLEGDLPAADYHSAIGSYLRFLDLELPPARFRPYFAAEPAQLRKPAGTKLTIGLVWAPRPLGEISIRRNFALGDFFSLAEIPGVALYSLQVGAAAHDIERHGGQVLVTDLSRRLRDWSDTAAYMAALDLIISIDSGPLHLAGALGRPTIGLLPFVSCWRWGARNTDTTPWYTSLRLLRQSAVGDWGGVIHQLGHTVVNRIANPDRDLQEKGGNIWH
jgi:hypothetical protein